MARYIMRNVDGAVVIHESGRAYYREGDTVDTIPESSKTQWEVVSVLDPFEMTLVDTVFTEIVDFEIDNGIDRDEDSYKTPPMDAELWQCVDRLNDLMAARKAWHIENR